VKYLLRFLALVALALRRLIHQRALTLCMVFGLTLAVALAAAIPAYVNVAQANVLRQRLAMVTGSGSDQGTREPFGMLFSYISFDGRRADAETYDALNDYVSKRVPDRAVLPVVALRRTISSDRYRVYATGDSLARYGTPEQNESAFERNGAINPPYLWFASFDVIDGIENQVNFDEGSAPAETGDENAPIEAMVERGMASAYGITSGDTFTVAIAYREQIIAPDGSKSSVENYIPVQVKITGVWYAKDVNSDFWTLAPAAMRESFVIREDTLRNRVMKAYPFVLTLALWNLQLDANALTVDDVDPLLSRATTFRQEAFQVHPSLRLQSRVVDSLADYRRSANELNLVLTVFSMPAFAMIVYFLALIAGMVVRQQESELAILQSRGSSPLDLFLLYVIQSVIMGVVALIVGIPLGLSVAGLIANTRSFLEFGYDQRLFLSVFRFSAPVMRTALIALGIGIVVTLVPVFGAAGRNIIVHGVSRARNLSKPFWQRAWLDLLLMIPCVYSYIQLRQRGSLATVTTQLEKAGELGATIARLTASDDPFRDPVRFLVPVLTVTALGLFAARLVPFVVGILAKLISLADTRGRATLPVFLALRELARSPGDYIAPLVLLIFTLGVAVFGASSARTLDQHLLEATRLVVGGDTRLIEDGESNKPATGMFSPAPSTTDNAEPELFSFPPVEDHLKIAGVQSYARIARIKTAPQTLKVDEAIAHTVFAVDRRAFHEIAQKAFRADYASRSFGELMNNMGRTRDGIIASQRFLSANGLKNGDPLVLRFALDQAPVFVTYTVRGGFTYFPIAAVDENNIGFVTDIAYTFEKIGKEMPYDVLVSVAPGANGRDIALTASKDYEFIVSDLKDTGEIIAEEQARPERQGMFGMLSASFVFITLLTLTGFAVYALLTFRRRSIEIGVMRAMGLSAGQMALYVIFLQTFVMLLGAAIGGAIGLLVSRLFVPFLQFGGTLIKSVPPFVVRVAWQDTALFYAALAVALAFVLTGSMAFLRRLKVFEVVKLGGG
jgi:putative ABC transport system permease protein